MEDYMGDLMVASVGITQGNDVQEVARQFSQAMYALERMVLSKYEDMLKRHHNESYSLVHEARIRALGGT